MWMLHMNTKAEFLQDSSFSFDGVILQGNVLAIEDHRFYMSEMTKM